MELRFKVFVFLLFSKIRVLEVKKQVSGEINKIFLAQECQGSFEK